MNECEYETNSISIFDYQFVNVFLLLFFMMPMTLGDKTMFNRKSFVKKEKRKGKKIDKITNTFSLVTYT